MINIDIPTRKINLIGVKGEPKNPNEMDAILRDRKSKWIAPENKFKKGILARYTRSVSSAMNGAIQ